MWSAGASQEEKIVCATARDVTDRRAIDEVLRAQTAELQAQTEELRVQGEQLQAKQRELEAKNLEVERASRLQSEFLANMSHELRTPLNAVIGFSELLLDEKSFSPTHVRYLEDILASGRHLLSLINDILDLVKIEAGRVTLSLEALAPAQSVADAVSLVEAAARKKTITIRREVRTESRIRGDLAKIRQILLNLLSNAIKFSPDGSSIEVGAESAGELVRFWVRDHGHGIAESLLPHLFQPFVQGENPLLKKHEGTGLGLAISKRLVEQHEGTMSVETHAGTGSVFTFTIPKWKGARAAPAEPSAAPVPAEKPRSAPTGEGIARAGSHRPLVVVVEDNAEFVKLLRAWLDEARS